MLMACVAWRGERLAAVTCIALTAWVDFAGCSCLFALQPLCAVRSQALLQGQPSCCTRAHTPPHTLSHTRTLFFRRSIPMLCHKLVILEVRWSGKWGVYVSVLEQSWCRCTCDKGAERGADVAMSVLPLRCCLDHSSAHAERCTKP